MTPRDYLPWLESREYDVTLTTSPVVIVEPNVRRWGLSFYVANAQLSGISLNLVGKVSTNQDLTLLTGFPVTLTTPLNLTFQLVGDLVTKRFYGIIGVGSPILTIVENLYLER